MSDSRFVFPVKKTFLANYVVQAESKESAKLKLEEYFNDYLSRGCGAESASIERIEVGLETVKIVESEKD